MDKLRSKFKAIRRTAADSSHPGNGTNDASQPSTSAHDNSSTHALNQGTAAHDFAASQSQGTLAVEPPTSLQSSIDAGAHVPRPSRYNDPSSLVSHSTLAAARARANSAPQRRPPVGVRQASIGIRRMPSSNALRSVAQQSNASKQRLNAPLPPVNEDSPLEQVQSNSSESTLAQPGANHSRLRKVKSAVLTRIPFWGSKEDVQTKNTGSDTSAPQTDAASMDYTSDMVDVLDTIDPEVATLTSLTNMQNSLFIPNLPFFNRRPTYQLRRRKSETESQEDIDRIMAPVYAAQAEERAAQAAPSLKRSPTGASGAPTLMTIDSRLSESRYAVLPEGTSLEGWSRDDKKEVNDHVRHMLHSRRSKFKRTMRGFGQYVRRPLGFLVTLYATLITLFGLAWVLFLIGWINVGGKQIYVVHVIDSVLVALFAIVGDGLAPFRAVDTYHMIYIAHYHHFTWSRRKKQLLPELQDHNDLPAGNAPVSTAHATDPEDPEKQWEFTVLTPKQQEKLEHHQAKFCKSHSFYKPHETETHYAFPLRFLIAIVVLLDCHSLLQISLGACTWGIDYKTRPFAITTVILICSITCNATAGLLIWLGDKRTRKKDVVERMNRQELTQEAIEKVERKKEKESESEREDDSDIREKRRISLDAVKGKFGEKREQSAYP